MTERISKYPSTFYRVSLKAVIRNEKDEVLVVKEYNADDWSLPGGGWDHGETEHEALARELFEEVGYQGEFTSQPFATVPYWMEAKRAWLLWIVYDVKTENNDFSVGEYCSDIAFIDPRSISKDAPSLTERWIRQNL